MLKRASRRSWVIIENDDDLSEVTLVPFEQGLSEVSARERKAIAATFDFRERLTKWWVEKDVATALPSMTIMTIQRAALKNFSLFLKLPLELQYLIWDFAAH